MATRRNIIEIPSREFVAFYERLLKKLDDVLIKKVGTIPQKLTVPQICDELKTQIELAPAVATYISALNGNRKPDYTGVFSVETKNTLYGNSKKAERGETIKINGTQLACALLFLSDGKYSTWESYISESEGAKTNFIEYTGFFYSFYQHKVLSFSVWMEFNGKDIYVEEQGFHIEPYDKIIFKGKGRKKNNYLFIDLTADREDYEDEFKLVAYVGNIPDPHLMTALFIGTSSYGYPTAGEAVLMKKELLKEEDIDIIKKYLMLKRSRIRVKNENYNQSSDLRVKKQPIPIVDNMIGTYWVWNFNSQGHIIQSKFVIDESYTARFFTDEYSKNERIQVCLLSISSVINRKLCMSVHPNEGTGVIAYVILNPTIDKKGITTGVYCSVGQHGQNPASGKIALLKAEQTDQVMPDCFEEEALAELLAANPKFQDLYDKLREISKRK